MENLTTFPNLPNTSSWTCFEDSQGHPVFCKSTKMIVHQGDNSTGELLQMTARDASWILTSAVIIFTMQTGFGLLESGCVSRKSEINIMVKNALDVVFGGFTYWAVGFGLSFGSDYGTNPFIGVGNFFLQCPEEQRGYIYALFLFQLSFATTATTIVSGAMTERTKLLAYNVFSLVNTFIYCLPAHWVWAETGFLYQLGVIDVAGCGPVHLIGGVTGLIATLMLGPRRSASELLKQKDKPAIQGPVKCILGMFMLWWGWLRFNSGSVFIVSTSSQWQYAVTAAVNTILASIGGGITSVGVSLLINRLLKQNSKYNVGTIVSGVLGALVSITSICTLCLPWEALAIGAIAPFLTSVTELLMTRLKVDDPVGVVPVHLVCAVWGLLTVGLFTPEHETLLPGQGGLVKTGKVYLLGVQALAVVVIATWSAIMSYISLKLIDLTIGLRLSSFDEDMGVDLVEHGSHNNLLGLDTILDVDIEGQGKTDPGTKDDPVKQSSKKSTKMKQGKQRVTTKAECTQSEPKARELMAGFLTLCDSLDMQVNISQHSSHNITIELGSKCLHQQTSASHRDNTQPGSACSDTAQGEVKCSSCTEVVRSDCSMYENHSYEGIHSEIKSQNNDSNDKPNYSLDDDHISGSVQDSDDTLKTENCSIQDDPIYIRTHESNETLDKQNCLFNDNHIDCNLKESNAKQEAPTSSVGDGCGGGTQNDNSDSNSAAQHMEVDVVIESVNEARHNGKVFLELDEIGQNNYDSVKSNKSESLDSRGAEHISRTSNICVSGSHVTDVYSNGKRSKNILHNGVAITLDNDGQSSNDITSRSQSSAHDNKAFIL